MNHILDPVALFVEEFKRDISLDTAPVNSRWIQNRHDAFESFSKTGLPTKKSESYKYSPISKLVLKGLTERYEASKRAPATRALEARNGSSATRAPKASGGSRANAFTDLPGLHLRTADGLLTGDSHTESLPEGLTLCSLKDAFQKDPEFVSHHLSAVLDLERDPFSTLAAALANDGIMIHLAAGTLLEETVFIHHDAVSLNSFVQPRMLVVTDEGSSLRIVEHFGYVGPGAIFENRLVEMEIAQNARLDHVLLYDRGDQASFVNGLHTRQASSSKFSTNTISLSGKLVRHNLNFLPNGEECETDLNGLYIANGVSHIDNHTIVDHAKPNCVSNELFKGIIADRAVGVFNGKVLVRQDAQKINAYQSSKSILLDRTATIYAKPELEIYADDVKCSHGATTGELDDEAIFYLKSRGLNEKSARLLLLEAFARDVVDLIEVEPVRTYLYSRLSTLLNGA